MAEDPLHGYRARSLSEDQRALFEAYQSASKGVDLEALQRDVQSMEAAIQFYSSPIGKYIMARIEECEALFLEAAKQASSTTEEDFQQAHFDYLSAVQTAMWLGRAVEEGQEAIARSEDLMTE